jgi:hypothetical protein
VVSSGEVNTYKQQIKFQIVNVKYLSWYLLLNKLKYT